ncbi:MAG: PRC-barrel domain containing protein [Chloroflexi bacterium]|nr:PRC-barrel domain containing protein [Chloroflexota bacterium]
MAIATTASLLRLSKEEQLMLADPAEDIRDKKVLDKGGEVIAEVEDLLIDEKDHKVRFMMVGSGGFGPRKIGKKKFLIPVDAITEIDDAGVHVDQLVDKIVGSPEYDPEVVPVPVYWETVYGWYGYYPFWGPAYRYPPYPYFRYRRW